MFPGFDFASLQSTGPTVSSAATGGNTFNLGGKSIDPTVVYVGGGVILALLILSMLKR